MPLLAAHNISLVLLDLSLVCGSTHPEMAPLLTMLNRLGIPTVAVAERFDAEAAVHLQRWGIDECLFKPFNPSIVRLRIRNVMTLNRLRRAVAAFGSLSDFSGLNDMAAPKKQPTLPAPKPTDDTNTVAFERVLGLLEQERLKYRMLIELTGDIVFSYDFPSDTITFSKKYTNIFGHKGNVTNAIGTIDANGDIHADDRGTLKQVLCDGSPEHPQSRAEIRLLIDAQYQWFEIHTIAIFEYGEGNGPARYRGCLGRLININTRVSETARWRRQASIDPLTGLDNRKCAEQHIQNLLENQHSHGALLFIDLDNFKTINDTYGHPSGDALLRDVAHILRSNVRTTDIVSRIGGDEFLIFLHPLANRAAISKKAEQLCRAFDTLRNNTLNGFVISCSIGIARSPKDATTFTALLEKADRALYQAKSQGKSRFAFYSPSSEQSAFDSRVRLETEDTMP